MSPALLLHSTLDKDSKRAVPASGARTKPPTGEVVVRSTTAATLPTDTPAGTELLPAASVLADCTPIASAVLSAAVGSREEPGVESIVARFTSKLAARDACAEDTASASALVVLLLATPSACVTCTMFATLFELVLLVLLAVVTCVVRTRSSGTLRESPAGMMGRNVGTAEGDGSGETVALAAAMDDAAATFEAAAVAEREELAAKDLLADAVGVHEGSAPADVPTAVAETEGALCAVAALFADASPASLPEAAAESVEAADWEGECVDVVEADSDST